MKKTIILAAMLIATIGIYAQHEMKDNQKEGYIITKKGKQEGIIWLNGSENTPWSLQKKIYFITKEDFDKMKKNKKKYFEDYSPKDISGYGFNDVEFEAVKYADLSAVGGGMIPKMYFLRVLVKGTMSVYRFHKTPPAIQSGDDLAKTNEEWIQEHDLVLRKGDGKLKDTERVNMDEVLADCESVKYKYFDGGYGFDPSNDGEKKGLKKAFAKAIDKDKIAEALVLIAKDYNKCE